MKWWKNVLLEAPPGGLPFRCLYRFKLAGYADAWRANLHGGNVLFTPATADNYARLQHEQRETVAGSLPAAGQAHPLSLG